MKSKLGDTNHHVASRRQSAYSDMVRVPLLSYPDWTGMTAEAERHIDIHRQLYNRVKWDYEDSPKHNKPNDYTQNNKLEPGAAGRHGLKRLDRELTVHRPDDHLRGTDIGEFGEIRRDVVGIARDDRRVPAPAAVAICE